ncbi:hypothetical protein KA005_83250 [bacterium]|nr:hypothetical protein [bacterium]
MTKSILTVLLLFLICRCEISNPRVLIIGDSISWGYFPYVKEALKEQAIIIHNEGNAQHTGTGLKKYIHG